jgi:hypothetical protein
MIINITKHLICKLKNRDKLNNNKLINNNSSLIINNKSIQIYSTTVINKYSF